MVDSNVVCAPDESNKGWSSTFKETRAKHSMNTEKMATSNTLDAAMQNKSKTRNKCRGLVSVMVFAWSILAAAAHAIAAPATTASVNDSTTPQELSNGNVTSSITTTRSRSYKLVFVKTKQSIDVSYPAGRTTVFKIEEGKDPSLVGVENHIRFLPMSLQPYMDKGDLLFIAAERTTDGDGGGQCGSGAEIYLKVLDVTAAKPKVIGSHLIDSCAESIESASSGTGQDDLREFSVQKGQLIIEFRSYKDVPIRSRITGQLSDDLTKLQITHTPE
jgi:hypothetical protein